MVREMRRASDIAAAAVMMATCTQCLVEYLKQGVRKGGNKLV